MEMVVDSNFLRSEALRRYLSASKRNVAVLTDYMAMEAYKGDPVIAVPNSMRILADFPSQIVILKGTQTIVTLKGRVSGLTRRMIDEGQTRQFRTFCDRLGLAETGDPHTRAQLIEMGRVAKDHFDRLLDDAADTAETFQGISANFTTDEIAMMRRGNRYAASLIEKIITLSMWLAAHSFKQHPARPRFPSSGQVFNTYIYRYCLCTMLLYVRWVEGGGQMRVSPAKARNDMVDMNIAAYGTYFDGVLTADAKLAEIHHISRFILSCIGGHVTV